MSFNLNDEIRDGVLVSSKMKRIWKVNMNLLAELDTYAYLFGYR